MDDEQLIFIISQPRSGSTLLQAILSSHHKIDTVSEPWIQLPLLSIYKPVLIQAKYDYQLAQDAFFDFIQKTSGIEVFNKEYKSFILKLYEKILSKPQNFVIDKTPRYYEIFDEIFKLFPNARYIILKRNPLAVFKSIITTWQRTTIQEITKYHCRDLFLAPFIIQKIISHYQNHPNIIILRYEDLLNDPELRIKELCKWLKIDYMTSMLKYRKNTSYKGKYGDPTGIHDKSTIDKSSAEDWRGYLRKETYKEYLEGYANYLGLEFLDQYGYPEYIRTKKHLRFRLLKYFCLRNNTVNHFSIKDLAAKSLLKFYFNESYK